MIRKSFNSYSGYKKSFTEAQKLSYKNIKQASEVGKIVFK